MTLMETLNTKKSTNFQTELFIKAIGIRAIKGMEKELKFGQMEQDMKAFGRKIRLMAKESSGMLMGMYLRESGKTIRLMALVFTHI